MSREFWLNIKDMSFDLNWREVWVAEYPHKDSIEEGDLHVIDYATHEKVLRALEKCREQRDEAIMGQGDDFDWGYHFKKYDAELDELLK